MLSKLLSPVLAAALAVSAISCDIEPEGSPTAQPSSPTSTPASSSPERTPVSSLSKMRLLLAFPALSFERLTGLYEPPDETDRLFAVEQPGRVMVFDNKEDVKVARVFLDIRGRVNSTGQEEGLLGLAFAPDYASSGQLYVNYTASNPRRSVISRFTVPAPSSGTADASSEFKILEVMQPFSNHNGGQTLFGPDGYLYIGFGDGGSGGDPMGNGQNLSVLLGKMLRINVNRPDGGRPYSIPPDNPFVGRTGAREEIWAYGLRNPWRFSFDPETKALMAADVGQNSVEELDIIQKGANYGWNRTEGRRCYPPNVTSCDMSGITLPVFEYPTAGGNCAVGGNDVPRRRAACSQGRLRIRGLLQRPYMGPSLRREQGHRADGDHKQQPADKLLRPGQERGDIRTRIRQQRWDF
ncbi:MAG: glucose sorbosone dehydrogenase [Dehalococcoidia bacterium]|nr:glucose sorbosone dehydrogenase [Dehalococcoidia bacterium]